MHDKQEHTKTRVSPVEKEFWSIEKIKPEKNNNNRNEHVIDTFWLGKKITVLVAQNHKTHLFNLNDPSDAELRAEHNGRIEKTQCQEGLLGHSKTENRQGTKKFRTMSLAQRKTFRPSEANRELSTTSIHTRDNEVRKVCSGI
jgi:hypothetical protein